VKEHARYAFNNSLNKNPYIDFENIFMDGGTGAINNSNKNESYGGSSMGKGYQRKQDLIIS